VNRGLLRRALASARRRTGLASDERAARTRFVQRAASFTPYVAVDSSGMTFIVSTTERTMVKFFAKESRPELRVLRRALDILESAGLERPRGTFLEGGANIGTATLAALGEGFSFVVACEPEPQNARVLRANVALNGRSDVVRVLEVALSSEPGTARLDRGYGSLSKARVLGDAEETSGGQTVEVRLVPLDDLAREGLFDPAEVGMLWLDVEGHEAQALGGASTTLGHSPPLVMELSPKLLRRAGGIDRLPDLLGRHYTHVADLRHGEAGGLRQVDAVPSLIEEYEQSHTDLLLCRVP
jgi:FkbM family methyltransferase